jgi:hypothetical protein
VREQAHDRFEEARVHSLPLAGALARGEREEDAMHRVEAGADVGDGDPDPRRTGAGLTGDAHDPAHGLPEDVVPREAPVRAVGAEPADRRADEALVARLQHLLIAEAPLLECARLEVVDDHVGVLEQAQRDLLALGLGQVEHHAALVAIAEEVVRALAAVTGRCVWRVAARERRAPGARVVEGRRLDLDDVRAVVAEHHRADRAGEDAGQVDDLQLVECRHQFSSRSRAMMSFWISLVPS